MKGGRQGITLIREFYKEKIKLAEDIVKKDKDITAEELIKEVLKTND